MTTLIQCFGLTHRAGTRPLFEELDLTISSGDRIGLVGHNGCGKSTLLKLLAGAIAPEGGDISRSRELRLETVEQFMNDALMDATLFEALACKLPDEERAYSEYRASALLDELGFEPASHSHRVRDLSGGQQNRLMFARAMINEPNFVLFDEPTNHLDLKTLLFFESYLQSLTGGYLLISHDREFLDAVTTRTLFLRDQRLWSFNLPFSEARARLAEMDDAAAAARASEEKEIAGLRASAKRLATWGKVYDNEKFARKAKSMEKRIERMEDDKTFVSRGSGLNLELDVQQSRANRMLALEQCSIEAPDGTLLFEVDEIFIRPGDRIALLGHNGVGKTTLINRLMDVWRSGEPDEHVRFNPQCDIGYYDQELETLDKTLTLTETLREHCQGSENTYKSALIKAGFPYLDLDKPVEVLSGGERARLMFLVIKLNAPNFLILDEPTNHIDIQGKEELEEQILASGATTLVTSHDRRFVDTIAERYWLIENGRLYETGSPAGFYRQADEVQQTRDAPKRAPATPKTPDDDEEALLTRLVELEALLNADLDRKPKFQKPERQAAWREEIAAINRRLE